MPRSYVKKRKRWNNDDVKKAVDKVKCGNSIRKAASKHNMSEGKLRQAIKKNEKGIDLSCQSGKKTSLSSEVEKTLPNVIGVLCKIGFSPSKDEVLDLVSKYFKENNIKAAKFKDGRPGPDWLKLFMKRNKLSFKKTNMISAARKSATSNPFIIYNFYDQLDEIVTQNNLTPKLIWNCDESEFPTHPQKCKVVLVKGEIAYKVTPGACRENITTLAVCNAV